MKVNLKIKKSTFFLGLVLVLIALTIPNYNFTNLTVNAYLDDNNNLQLKNAIEDWHAVRPEPVGTNPVSVFIGDANNDGYKDIVTANMGSGSISILMWNTYYNDWDPAITLPVGSGPRSVFIGDADNDNYNDIVIANNGNDNVSILLWNSTSITWDPEITRSVGDGPRSVFIGDADNDNYNDIVTADESNGSVSILRWNTLKEDWDTQITRSVGNNPLSVFIGDADNDNDNDIVTANSGHNNISILLWNETNNNWDTQITKSVGNSPGSVVIEDANNDGYNDIVTANSGSDTISILLWNLTYSNWDTQITISVGDLPTSVFIGDANNDGYNDIVTANFFHDNISIIMWNAVSGNWDAEITKSAEDGPNSVYIGDANNDGLNDIVCSTLVNNKVLIYLGKKESLAIEIVEQIFTSDNFNITFSVLDENGYGIESATIDMWWNAINVSSNVQNLGSGLYFVSLEPITIEKGEDPILLNMTIISSNYYEKYYETSISVQQFELSDLIFVEVIDQIYSTNGFNITFIITNATADPIDSATIQMWWDGMDVSSDIQNLGNGHYFVSLEPITIEEGENPILLNVTINAAGYEEKYYETSISVQQCELSDLIFVEVIDLFYSTNEFNITFIITNAFVDPIDSGTIQMWWDGTDVSDDVQNLGDGIYFISLDPITVEPGENPILLTMTISALGYLDKDFELAIAVDPEILDKSTGLTEGIPLPTIIIIIVSIVGSGVGVSIVLVWYFKKKSVNASG